MAVELNLTPHSGETGNSFNNLRDLLRRYGGMQNIPERELRKIEYAREEIEGGFKIYSLRHAEHEDANEISPLVKKRAKCSIW